MPVTVPSAALSLCCCILALCMSCQYGEVAENSNTGKFLYLIFKHRVFLFPADRRAPTQRSALSSACIAARRSNSRWREPVERSMAWAGRTVAVTATFTKFKLCRCDRLSRKKVPYIKEQKCAQFVSGVLFGVCVSRGCRHTDCLPAPTLNSLVYFITTLHILPCFISTSNCGHRMNWQTFFYFSSTIRCKLRSREGGPNEWNLLRAGTFAVHRAALSIKQDALHAVQNCILTGYLMLSIVLLKQ